jgi:predicted Zn-dependent peptidase
MSEKNIPKKYKTKPIRLFLIFGLTCLLVFPLAIKSILAKTNVSTSASSQETQDPFKQIEERVAEFTLSNGMRVLLVKQGFAPVFSAYIRFKVGGADEDPNYTGMAHLFEHMAFKGTPTIGTTNYKAELKIMDKIEELGIQVSGEYAKGEDANPEQITLLRGQIYELQKEQDQYIIKNEFWKILEENGGADLNASTSKDATNYYVSLPIEKLPLWAFMESERLGYPVMREFYQERDVIAEERRMQVDTNPFGLLYENFLATAFSTSPYRWPTLGWMNNINTITMNQATQFYKRHYVPENSVLSIVGDIDLLYTKELIEFYFGKLKANPRSSKPPMPSMDDSIFDVISSILGEGRTSRLYRSLVEKKRIASSVVAYNGSPGSRGTNLFIIIANPIYPHTTGELESAIYKELEILKTQPVTEEELQKVRLQFDKEFLWSLKTNNGLASSLSYFELLAGDWRYIINNRNIIHQVTPEQILEVANRYLIKSNRTVATLVKETK